MVKVIRFTAPWCQPCKVVAPILQQIQSRYPDVRFEVVDTDNNTSKVLAYNISSVPTVIVERDGQPISYLIGVKSAQDYEAAIKTALHM